MKKNLNKLATLALTGILMTGMSFGALAEDAGQTSEITTPVSNNVITFKKQLGVWNVNEKEAFVTVPNISYSYKIEPYTAGTVTKDGEVLYSVAEGKGSEENITAQFFSSDTADNHVVTKNVNLNLNFVVGQGGVTEPGIYRYKITETAKLASEADMYNYDGDVTALDENAQVRILDVYVGYVNEGGSEKLAVLSTVMFKKSSTDTYDASGKTDGYEVTTNKEGNLDTSSTTESIYKTYNLELTKEIAGNMVSANENFNFEVALTGVPYGIEFVTYNSNTGETGTLSDKTDANPYDGNITGNGVALKAEKTLTIKSVPADVYYNFTERLTSDQTGYTTKWAKNLTDGDVKKEDNYTTESNTTNMQTISVDAVNHVYFMNIRRDLVPEGVVKNIAPYAAMILGAGAFAGVFLGRKKSEDEE